jgi:hypothetical protein
MRNAYDARKDTLETIKRLAEEVIINEVANKVNEAVSWGKFNTTVYIKGVSNPQVVGKCVVDILENTYGYVTKFVHIDNQREETTYIDISWEEYNRETTL